MYAMLQVVELDVKERTENEMGAAKIVCVPFDQPELLEGIILIQISLLVLLNLNNSKLKSICCLMHLLSTVVNLHHVLSQLILMLLNKALLC
jgi:hypothetical protein